MNRLQAVKTLGTALAVTALSPIMKFVRPSKAERDTVDLENLVKYGGTITERELIVCRTIDLNCSNAVYTLKNCRLVASPDLQGAMISALHKGGNSKSLVMNIEAIDDRESSEHVQIVSVEMRGDFFRIRT